MQFLSIDAFILSNSFPLGPLERPLPTRLVTESGRPQYERHRNVAAHFPFCHASYVGASSAKYRRASKIGRRRICPLCLYRGAFSAGALKKLQVGKDACDPARVDTEELGTTSPDVSV